MAVSLTGSKAATIPNLNQKTVDRRFEALNRIGRALVAELDLERIVQIVTDSATELSGAKFGAFFYNVIDAKGERYTLYALSGAPREAFDGFAMPRNTQVFEPTFGGKGIVRSADIRLDPRYGKNAPHFGMPKGHLPVVSYLAVPVVSRTGEILGGLFFGHPEAEVFSAETEELVESIAVHAAIAIDNSRLIQAAQEENSRRRALEASSSLLAALVESSDDAIIGMGLDGIVTSWNRGAERLYGYSQDEIVGEPIAVLLPLARRGEEPELIARLLNGESIDHFETVRQRKDGSLLNVSLTISAIRDPSGKVVGASKIARDITARRKAELSLEARIQEQTALFQFVHQLQHARTLDDVCNASLIAIRHALRCERASILLFDDAGSMRFVAWRGLSEAYRLAVEGHSPWSATARDPQPIFLSTIDAREISPSLRPHLENEQIGALAFIPLTVGGRLVGKFMLYYNSPHEFAEAERELALTLSRQFSFNFHRLRAEEAQHRAERQLFREAEALSLINAAGSRLWRLQSMRDGLDEMLAASMQLLQADMGSIDLVDADRRRLETSVQVGFADDAAPIRPISTDGSSPRARALRTGTRVAVEDTTLSEAPALSEEAKRHGYRALQATPLIGREGAVLGVISTFFKGQRKLTAQELRLLDLYSSQAADFIERCARDEALARSEARARAQAVELQAIMESVPTPIWIARDPECRTITGNHAANQLLRMRSEANASLSAPTTERPTHFQVLQDGETLEPQELPVQRAALGEEIRNFEEELRFSDGTSRFLLGNATPLRDGEGQPIGGVAAFVDITERKRAEQQRDLLMGELNHRVKNTLATVMSIEKLSFAKSADVNAARRSFGARLQALAHTHSRLAESNWSGVLLTNVIRDELAPYATDDAESNVFMTGVDVTLNPKCAMSLGLAIHEMTTNAAKYGALSTQKGRVNIEWQVDPRDATLEICWVETNGPAVTPPTRSGFGRMLVEQALASEMNGTVKLDFAAKGLRCKIRIPADHYAVRIS